ncbi:MAG: polyphosphate kinase 2 [Candidatus Sedimenticola sp. 20ELBAFRAG]
MAEELNTDTGLGNHPETVERPPEYPEDNSFLPVFSDPGSTQHAEELLQENQRLREKIAQLEKRQKKTSRKLYQVKELAPYQAELIRLQQCLERRGKKMIIVFEGRGAAGKGGTIRRITQYMNAKHYRVVALGKPTAEERSQWFYQRYIRQFPRAGEMVLFDRSWYTRAMIEPVFGFCTDEEYENFFEGVSGFEMDLVSQDIILIKLYLSVSQEEQTRRFEQRKDDPLQHWKLNEVDLDAEERRAEFTAAKYEMLRHTHTVHAPWTIIRSDIKHQARLNAMKVILNAVDYERLDPTLDITPDTAVTVSGAYELERMEAHRLKHGSF